MTAPSAPEEPLAPSDPVLVDDVAERILASIRSGDHPIGTWLRQEALATAFGVSRTPIREALRKLQADRVVEVFPHRGALVRGPTAAEMREAYQIRGELEGLAAELAATRITEDGLRRLLEAERTLAASFEALLAVAASSAPEGIRSGPWDLADLAFRDVLLEAAGVERLARMATDMRDAFPRNLTWAALAEEPSLLDENLAQRARVRAAIERGDAAAARRWMADHCRRTGALVAAWYDERRPAEEQEAGPRDIRARVGRSGPTRG
jgi:DNA-binding GntR family transcriptional regulator